MPAPNLVAAGNIYPSRFVKSYASGDNAVVQAGANEAICGISNEAGRSAPIPEVSTNYAAISGDALQVYGLGDTCLLELGDTVTRGNLLKGDADGKGVPIASSGTTLQQYGARALKSGVVGEKVLVQIVQGSVYPALS